SYGDWSSDVCSSDLPTLDDLPLALKTQQHEGRRPARKNKVGVHGGKFTDFCLVHRHRRAKFLLRAAGEVRCYICDTNIGRHFVVELGLSTIRPVGGADPADEIFLFCCGHMLSSLRHQAISLIDWQEKEPIVIYLSMTPG